MAKKSSTIVVLAAADAAEGLCDALSATFEKDFVQEAVAGESSVVGVAVVGQSNAQERDCYKAFVSGLAYGSK